MLKFIFFLLIFPFCLHAADKRISELNSLAAASWASGDLFTIVDISASETKKTTVSDLSTHITSLISASSPLTYSSGSVGCQTASISQAGCISSSSFTTFSNKFGSVTYNSSTPSRSVNTNFTPSSTDAVFTNYSVRISCTVLQTSTVELRSDTNATPTTVRVSTTFGGIAGAVDIPLSYLVPPTHNVRINSSGTCTVSVVAQSEVAIAFGT